MYTDEMRRAFRSLNPPKNFSLQIIDNDNFLTVKAKEKDFMSLETVEMEVKRGFFGRRWSRVILDAKQLARLGTVTAWRATLLDNKDQVTETHSFLW